MSPDTDNEFYIKEAKDMVNIIQRLISDGKYVKRFYSFRLIVL